MDNKNDVFRKLITEINKGTKYPSSTLVKDNPLLAAVVSKLTKPVINKNIDIRKNSTSNINLNQSEMTDISRTIESRIVDNENIIKLFPDLELAIQILVSSILSPKDMVKSELIYTNTSDMLTADLSMKVNNIISSNIEGYHKVKEELQDILRESLFTTGSYIKAIIPEAVLDEVINSNIGVSNESLKEVFNRDNTTVNYGILGSSSKKTNKSSLVTALENFNGTYTIPSEEDTYITFDGLNKDNFNIQVSDNYQLLKLPKVISAHNRNKVRRLIQKNISNEAIGVPNKINIKSIPNQKLISGLYSDTSYENNEIVQVLPTRQAAKRKSVGRPLVMKLPSESVIPVYVPGDESTHIGYFVLLDIDGNPLNSFSDRNMSSGLQSVLNNTSNTGNNNGLASMLVKKAKNNLIGQEREPTITEITAIYGSIIENDLLERLKNGMYGSNVGIQGHEEIYRIMLGRSLAGKYTRILYIPSELVTYFTFKYFNNGTGKSLFEDIKVLTSLRGILLFSKIMAMVKSSINLTKVNVTFDPNDPDPQKTAEIAMHEVVKMSQNYFPLGINSPVDMVDWIQRAGYQFTFDGHPGMPQTKLDFDTGNQDHHIPDADIDEQLRKQTYMALGLSPEVIDNGFNAEFATTVITNNILMSKRIWKLQEIFCHDLSDYVRKIVLSDTDIKQEIVNLFKENKDSLTKKLSEEDKEFLNQDESRFYLSIIERYVDELNIELPKPDTTTLENQTASFDTYSETLDKVLDCYISDQVINESSDGMVSEHLDNIKAALKTYYQRNWLAENGFMTEIADIVTQDEEGNPNIDLYDVVTKHKEAVSRCIVKYIESSLPNKIAADKDLENMNAEEGTAVDSSSSSSSSSDDSGEEGGEGEGGDNIGSDDMAGFNF